MKLFYSQSYPTLIYMYIKVSTLQDKLSKYSIRYNLVSTFNKSKIAPSDLQYLIFLFKCFQKGIGKGIRENKEKCKPFVFHIISVRGPGYSFPLIS